MIKIDIIKKLKKEEKKTKNNSNIKLMCLCIPLQKENFSDGESDRYCFGRKFPIDFQRKCKLVIIFRRLKIRQKTVRNFRPFSDDNNLKYYPSAILQKSVGNVRPTTVVGNRSDISNGFVTKIQTFL